MFQDSMAENEDSPDRNQQIGWTEMIVALVQSYTGRGFELEEGYSFGRIDSVDQRGLNYRGRKS